MHTGLLGRAIKNNGHSHFLRGAGFTGSRQKNALTSLLNQTVGQRHVRGTSTGAYLRFFSAMKSKKFRHPEIFYILVYIQ